MNDAVFDNIETDAEVVQDAVAFRNEAVLAIKATEALVAHDAVEFKNDAVSAFLTYEALIAKVINEAVSAFFTYEALFARLINEAVLAKIAIEALVDQDEVPTKLPEKLPVNPAEAEILPEITWFPLKVLLPVVAKEPVSILPAF